MKYAIYSEKQKALAGSSVYLRPDGTEVEVTMSNLIVPGILAVLLAFAAYVWNDLDSGIKALDEKAEKINVTLEEHNKSIFTLRNYLSLTDQNFRFDSCRSNVGVDVDDAD